MTKPTPAESVEGAQSLKNTAIPDQAVVRNSDGTAERGGLERVGSRLGHGAGKPGLADRRHDRPGKGAKQQGAGERGTVAGLARGCHEGPQRLRRARRPGNQEARTDRFACLDRLRPAALRYACVQWHHFVRVCSAFPAPAREAPPRSRLAPRLAHLPARWSLPSPRLPHSPRPYRRRIARVSSRRCARRSPVSSPGSLQLDNLGSPPKARCPSSSSRPSWGRCTTAAFATMRFTAWDGSPYTRRERRT